VGNWSWRREGYCWLRSVEGKLSLLMRLFLSFVKASNYLPTFICSLASNAGQRCVLTSESSSVHQAHSFLAKSTFRLPSTFSSPSFHEPPASSPPYTPLSTSPLPHTALFHDGYSNLAFPRPPRWASGTPLGSPFLPLPSFFPSLSLLFLLRCLSPSSIPFNTPDTTPKLPNSLDSDQIPPPSPSNNPRPPSGPPPRPPLPSSSRPSAASLKSTGLDLDSEVSRKDLSPPSEEPKARRTRPSRSSAANTSLFLLRSNTSSSSRGQGRFSPWQSPIIEVELKKRRSRSWEGRFVQRRNTGWLELLSRGVERDPRRGRQGKSGRGGRRIRPLR